MNQVRGADVAEPADPVRGRYISIRDARDSGRKQALLSAVQTNDVAVATGEISQTPFFGTPQGWRA